MAYRDQGWDATPEDWRTLLLLVCWLIWKHRNAIVFDGASPDASTVLRRIYDEGRTWQLAGLLSAEVGAFFDSLSRWVSSE